MESTDHAGMVYFTRSEALMIMPLPIGGASLLDLRVGSSGQAVLPERDDERSALHAEDAVYVGGALVAQQACEVGAVFRRIERLNRQYLLPSSTATVGNVPCHLCPFRRFRMNDTTRRRLLAHLRRYHKTESVFGLFCRIRTNFGRARPRLVNKWSNEWCKCGRHRPSLDESGPTSVENEPCSAAIAQNWQTIGQSRPKYR